ncbi:RNA polymerase [Viola virus]|uniref:RNA-directed RNA polymerase L n=1 Tax=Viola virus TaxID=2182586 RepID=A0A343X9V8_9VIRU|nr:RNA polymerase [Viola virus]AWH90184.1 RNA polymerase [Viola virus]
MGDDYDGLTPDFIIETNTGVFHVVEFTTTRAGEHSASEAAYTKIAKYEIACQARSQGRSVCLSVISVHRDGVWSNLELTEQEVDELCYRYRMALSIFEEIKKEFPKIQDSDEDLARIVRQINGVLSMISMDWDRTESKFPLFRRDVIETFPSFVPDEAYLSKITSMALKKAQEDLVESAFLKTAESDEERLKLNLQECRNKCQDFKDQFGKGHSFRDRDHQKSTVQIPPWVTYIGHEGKDLRNLRDLSVEGDHPMVKVWRTVVEKAVFEEISRMYDDPKEELQYALSGELKRDDQKSKYHRVKVTLDAESSDYVNSLGVEGKSNRHKTAVTEARARGKLGFSLDHDTSSIEDFLNESNNNHLLEPVEELYSPLSADEELRKLAGSIHQPRLFTLKGENEFLRAHKQFMASRLGSWTQMVSVIGAELSASVKQHVGPGQFVVKRLMDSAIYLLIKPTSSKGHIFVSFAVEKQYLESTLINSKLFRDYFDAGDLFVTDFTSFKLSKLTNLCKTNSLIECALFFWTEAYGFPCWEAMKILPKDRSTSATDAVQMAKISLLTLLEDKARTEELQTMMRYIMMEGFVSQPEIPKPHKMISKLPSVLRSELQVFLCNRVFLSMERIASKPFRISKSEGQITWSGLFNPLTGSVVRDLQPVISACYNGYFKNKEEDTEPSVLSAMYKKIIELEHLMPMDEVNLGLGDPVNPEMHEFSRSYLKRITDHGKQLLSRIYGPNFMSLIEDQIMKEISLITLERLATLKATSNFDETWYIYKDIKPNTTYSRDKLIVKMANYADEGHVKAIEKFESCMRIIEERGAMHICLFKKQQHGGLREIYVLGAEERIVQCIVEAISRSIGKFFPSDTLCNPGNKAKIPETHAVRARKQAKGAAWTTSTSDDARKWNQGHFVTKFAMMLMEFTNQKWWPVIIRGCSMFTNKRMMLNLRYLDILYARRELEVDDEFAKAMHGAFHGEISVPWAEKGMTYISTKTGMMQGILHFTSSLLHTLHQEFIRSLSFKVFNLKVAPETSHELVIDMMQGSDDSSMIISFPCKNESFIAKCKVASAISFRIKRLLGLYAGIYPSEKSTSNTDFALEYNSEFYFHSQHVRPTIRWIAASCSLPEVETLVARQEEASNLLTSVAEGGGSFSLVAQIQQAQCTIHYMLMGMGVSSLFEEFIKAIRQWLDPGLGFFLLDNPYAAGLGGFRYNLYQAINRTNLKRLYAFFLRKVRGMREVDDEGNESLIEPEACSVSPGGALILSSSLRWGSREKFRKLKDRLHIPEDWKEQINQRPRLLYEAPLSGKDITLRIAEKVHSPGIVSSLSTGNAVAKVMASAVYFLSASIFEDAGRQEYHAFTDTKYSLLQKMALYEGFKGQAGVSKDDMLFLFPNISELEQLDAVVYNKEEIHYLHRINQREATQTKITVFDNVSQHQIVAEKLVSDKWFGTNKSHLGRVAFEREWRRLKTTVSWLRDTPSETLEASPLDSHIQIKNFFARMEGKARTVRITGAPVKKRSGVSKISLVIRDNFVKCGHLDDIEDLEGIERSTSSEVSKHFLFSILQGPYTPENKEHRVIRALQELPEVGIKEQDRKTKTNVIGILQNWSKSKSGVAQLIEEVGAGIIGGFIKRQRSEEVEGKIVYFGPGIWRGTMDGYEVQLEVTNQKHERTYLKSVTVSEKASIWELCPSIRSWCDDVGVINTRDVSKHASRSGLRYWMYDFRAFGIEKPFGCPVYITQRRMNEQFIMDEDDIKLKVRGKTINLYVEDRRNHIHILSYTAGDNDISPLITRNNSDPRVQSLLSSYMKEPSRSWVTCQSLPFAFIDLILKLVEGDIHKPEIDSESLGKIIKTCLQSSLRNKVGSMFRIMPSASTAYAAIDVDDVFDIMLEDMTPDMFKSTVQDMELDIQEDYQSEKFDFTDIDLFGPANFKEITDLAMISHPLMDDFVSTLIAKSSRKEIRAVVEKCVCSKRNEQDFKLLYRALGMNPKDIRVEESYHADAEEDADLLG